MLHQSGQVVEGPAPTELMTDGLRCDQVALQAQTLRQAWEQMERG
jgi:hypothetical protein